MSSLPSETAGVPPKLVASRSSASVGLLIGLVMMLAAGATLFVFNPVEHAFYPQCYFHQVTGWQCPGCGGLRAMHQLLHGHLLTALHLNVLAVASLPMFGWLLGREFLGGQRGIGTHQFVSTRRVWGGVAVLLVFWVLRNLPMFACFSP